MIIFDIETFKSDDEQYLAYKSGTIKAPSNYKDPEKIQAYIEEATKERAEKFALSALTGKIILIGMLTNNIPDNFKTILLDNNALTAFNLRTRDLEREAVYAIEHPDEEDKIIYMPDTVDDIWYFIQLGLNGMTEDKMLGAFWYIVQYDLMQQGGKLIGYNSTNFDLPYLIRRSIINKVSPPASLHISRLTAKYNNNIHYDIYRALEFNGQPYESGSLIDWQYLLGGYSLERDGSKIKGWYEAGEHQKIIDKNIADLFQTKKVWESIDGWLK